MTTQQQLNQSFDKLAETALQVKRERDLLLKACQRAYADLDNHYDVDQYSEGGGREYPFSGAGELMTMLKRAIDKAVQS